MVTKRIRSEYMKRFKDPKWDSYARCYENLLKYRLSRRLLEQAHNPWFWGECGSETDSSGTSTPLGRNKVEPQRSRDVKAAPDATPEPAAEHQERDAQTRDAEQNHPIGEEEKRRESTPVLNAESDTHTQNKAKPKRLSSHKSSRSKGKPHATKDAPKDATKDATKDPDKENRHPFALYGAGEKQTDMASRKTHNVGPAASTSEIHESALRAKTRREAEKQIRRVDKQRAKSVDLEKSGIKIVPDYNPWMTEYMRCFSARAR